MQTQPYKAKNLKASNVGAAVEAITSEIAPQQVPRKDSDCGRSTGTVSQPIPTNQDNPTQQQTNNRTTLTQGTPIAILPRLPTATNSPPTNHPTAPTMLQHQANHPNHPSTIRRRNVST
jgi:hypothetical protein